MLKKILRSIFSKLVILNLIIILIISMIGTNSAVTDSIGGIIAGGYTCTVTDSLGCLDSLSFTISEPPALSLTLNSSDVSCNGGSDGTASTSVSGGSGSLS